MYEKDIHKSPGISITSHPSTSTTHSSQTPPCIFQPFNQASPTPYRSIYDPCCTASFCLSFPRWIPLCTVGSPFHVSLCSVEIIPRFNSSQYENFNLQDIQCTMQTFQTPNEFHIPSSSSPSSKNISLGGRYAGVVDDCPKFGRAGVRNGV